MHTHITSHMKDSRESIEYNKVKDLHCIQKKKSTTYINEEEKFYTKKQEE